jgi:hypothetical protein
MTEIDDLKKAIEQAEGATEPLKKSQMELNFTPGPNPHHNPASKADRLAKKAGELTEAAVESENTGGSDAAHLHYAAGQAHTDAMHAARREGKGSVAAYHHSQADAHHRAYTRINASGTVSNIQAKGTPKVDDIVHVRLPIKGVPNTMSPPQQAQVVSTDGEHATVRHMASGKEHRVHVSQITSKPDTDAQVWVDPAKQRREMDAADTARQVNFMHPAFSQKGKDGRVYLHDSQTGQQLDNYEGPFHPDGDTSKTLHTWIEDGERNYSARPLQAATASPEVQVLVGSATELIGDMIRKPEMSKYREVIQRKLDALNANPSAKAAHQVISDVRMIAEKVAKEARPNDPKAAKELKRILESPDFGFTEAGGNGRVKSNPDGTITVYDGFYYGEDEARQRHIEKWSENGSYGKYFKDEGYNIKVVGSDSNHESKVFKRVGSTRGGDVSVTLAVTKAPEQGIEAHGVKGMNSTPWRKEFKSQKHFEKWLEKNDGNVSVHGTRKI